MIDLVIDSGEIRAQVQGSTLYKTEIKVQPYGLERWQKIITECSGKIDSLIELLQGTFSNNVMAIMIDKKSGLLPSLKEIIFSCSCPDYSSMCKHIAAVVYGVAARLDESPEQLFVLRQVNYTDLFGATKLSSECDSKTSGKQFDDLSALFDIEFEDKEMAKKPIVNNNIPKKKEIAEKKKKPTKKVNNSSKKRKSASELIGIVS